MISELCVDRHARFASLGDLHRKRLPCCDSSSYNGSVAMVMLRWLGCDRHVAMAV